jgi:hypothetical protein
MDNDDNTSRIGKRWTTEEDDQLCQEIEENKTYDEIALSHKRTLCGIKSRVITNIMYPKYKNDNITIDELSELYKIDVTLIEKYIQKLETPSIKKPSKKEDIIEYRLMMIEQKLDTILNPIYNS